MKAGTTRMAPTPSGWLHIGNLCSFLLTRFWADFSGSQLLLRIDDLDSDRSRDIFIDDLFHQLKWAGIQWELGPQSLAQHKEHFSQQWSFDFYQTVLDEKRAEFPELFFVCACSRKDKHSGKNCDCRNGNHPLVKGDSALMLDLRSFQGQEIEIRDLFGRSSLYPFTFARDEIPILRKEGIFAYHWVSLNEDRRHRIDSVIRGNDLIESTLLQVAIENRLFPNSPIFARAGFFHHALLTGPDGEKLSKSESSQSVLDLRNHGFGTEHLNRVFADFIGMKDADSFDRPDLYAFLESKWQRHEQ
jgi:glutamyl/glutaminyl-tRNA synthetase